MAEHGFPLDKTGDKIQVGDVLGSHVPEFWDRDQRTVVAIRTAGARRIADCGPGRFPINLHASQHITVTGFNSAEAVASKATADTSNRTSGPAGRLERRPYSDSGAGFDPSS